VNVTVPEYEPVLYFGSFVNVHPTEALLPAMSDRASAPNVATFVALEVEAVTDPLHAVADPLLPGAATVHTYFKTSPAVGGVATDGPPAGLKSPVTCRVIEPLPAAADVRTKYERFVVPV
jgi:hypothetical protein